MYSEFISVSAPRQSHAAQTITSDLDASVIEVYSGSRIYRLDHERNAQGEPIDYWWGRVLVAIGDAVQVLGFLPHYYDTPEGALAALRERYPEPEPQTGSTSVVR